MDLTIIIPAYNEEAYLGSTLDAIEAAAAHLRDRAGAEVETIVVDNNSDDATAAIAAGRGARVIAEPVQGIGRARNAGARAARGEVLVFIDADVIAPRSLLSAIHNAMRDPSCVGGAVDVDYRPRRRSMRLYLRAWGLLARVTGMAQGAAQFCRRDAFEDVGGYDEQVWIGEDVDFYWSLKRLAKRSDGLTRLIRQPRVRPSTRRFDHWPLWRVLVWTNPVVIALLRRWKRAWSGWYSDPVR
ncbi:MAG: glycosyltransferase [Chloroflexi bacterium]|nr:glycosyltransferase [Chloroflexota bacterium]